MNTNLAPRPCKCHGQICIKPLVQHLPKHWELLHDYGMTTLALNPIRIRPDGKGRLSPVACNLQVRV
jgi:hypothetical protein